MRIRIEYEETRVYQDTIILDVPYGWTMNDVRKTAEHDLNQFPNIEDANCVSSEWVDTLSYKLWSVENVD
jgi:hypothetical protein